MIVQTGYIEKKERCGMSIVIELNTYLHIQISMDYVLTLCEAKKTIS
jgi:hypothetical protein